MNSESETCQICLALLGENKFVVSCSHVFCKPCLEEFCNNKINSHHVGEKSIICPSEKCGKPLNYYEIKDIVSRQLFEKYDQQITELCNPKKDERQFLCPKCNCIMFIPPKDEISFVKCRGDNCDKTWCTNEECMGDWKDHANLSCQEYNEKFANKMDSEKKFNKLVEEKGWNKCPVCGVLIEKIKNCNYVRCESAKCQKKTIFCYICGKPLKDNEINSHYQENNNFKTCVKNEHLVQKDINLVANNSEDHTIKKDVNEEENKENKTLKIHLNNEVEKPINNSTNKENINQINSKNQDVKFLDIHKNISTLSLLGKNVNINDVLKSDKQKNSENNSFNINIMNNKPHNEKKGFFSKFFELIAQIFCCGKKK